MMTDISPSKPELHHPSSSVPSFRHLPSSPSLISLTRSEGDTPLYAPTLVQDPSVIDLPSQSDIIIAYVDQAFKLASVSRTQNPTVSWARPERVKVQSVFLCFNSSQCHSL